MQAKGAFQIEAGILLIVLGVNGCVVVITGMVNAFQ